jgi:hypothetical protein
MHTRPLLHVHRLEGLHVMSQNVALIREINELRREIKVRPRTQDLEHSDELFISINISMNIS